MSPSEATAAQIRRLVAELKADRQALVLRWQEIERFSQAKTSEESTSALALALDRSYTALESVLERVARNLEGGPPSGEDWHRSLLKNATLEIEQIRPPILTERSISAADELRRFRHFLRHAYASTLDGNRVTHLAQLWLSSRSEIESDLIRFEAFLVGLADRLAGS